MLAGRQAVSNVYKISCRNHDTMILLGISITKTKKKQKILEIHIVETDLMLWMRSLGKCVTLFDLRILDKNGKSFFEQSIAAKKKLFFFLHFY